MTKRRSTWLGASGALFLILSLSGVAAGATPPDAVPDVVVDTTASFEDIDGNGIDDDCQDVAAVLDEDAAAAALLELDTNADGVVSTTEAAHSDYIGGKNCNHGGYVSWIAHQDVTCADEPTEPVTEPAVELIVAEPEADACAADAEAAKAEKAAAAALRAALKADRTLARETAKAERTAAREAAKAERSAARDAMKAERAAARAAAKAERAAAKAERAAAKARKH